LCGEIDEIARTLGEGTFGKVVECRDLHRWETKKHFLFVRHNSWYSV